LPHNQLTFQKGITSNEQLYPGQPHRGNTSWRGQFTKDDPRMILNRKTKLSGARSN